MGIVDGVIGAITSPITSVANIVGGAWNDFTGKTATQMQIDAARENTAQQIAWEKERATNAHQWEVQDLEKAGLNPILSAGGSGAATGGINPPMPDTSSFKGLGALIPLIGSMYDFMEKNATSANQMEQARAAKMSVFERSTQGILNLYNSGLINAKTAGQYIDNQINQINLDWLPYEKGVGIAKDVVQTILPGFIGWNISKGLGNSATQISKGVKTLNRSVKQINNPWKDIGDGRKVNLITGEMKNSRKSLKLNKNIINKNLKKK